MFKDDNSTSAIEQIVEDNLNIPEELPILTLMNQVAFPTLNMTLSIQAEATSLIEKAMKGDRIIGDVGIQIQLTKRFQRRLSYSVKQER